MNAMVLHLMMVLLAQTEAPLSGARIDHSAFEETEPLHQAALVFDAHCDTTQRLGIELEDFGVRQSSGHLDLVRMSEGGLDAQVFAIWVDPQWWPDRALYRALDLTLRVLKVIEANGERMGLAQSAADVRKLNKQNKIATFLGIEGGYAIEDRLENLKVFREAGIRLMTLTWNKNTSWADSSGDEPKWGGLTDFGEAVVREMNRLGLVVDLSHASDEVFYHALKVSQKPVVLSHSGCRALCDHPRNASDGMLKALAQKGGVIGITFYPGFLDGKASAVLEKMWKAIEPEIERVERRFARDPDKLRYARQRLIDRFRKRVPRVSIDRVVDHIDHVVKIAGIDAVGLGSDFDGISFTPVGLEDVSRLPNLTEKLKARGYSDADIRKILGENLLRVFQRAMGN